MKNTHGGVYFYFHVFKIAQIGPNCATHHIYIYSCYGKGYSKMQKSQRRKRPVKKAHFHKRGLLSVLSDLQSFRGSRSQMFLKIENFAFTGKHQCWSLFLIKLQTYFEATTLLKRTPTQVFSGE